MRKPRWHVWSTRDGNVLPPRLVEPELWKTLRTAPHENSADGNWREYHDDAGNPYLVLVRL